MIMCVLREKQNVGKVGLKQVLDQGKDTAGELNVGQRAVCRPRGRSECSA